MRPPRFLLGAALLLWGWTTGLLWVGAAAAVAVELPGFVNTRWEFSQADLDRIWNLCIVLFLGATIYSFVSNDNLTAVGELLRENSPSSRLATLNQSKRSLFQLLQWLPLMFLPICLAEGFGIKAGMDLSTFSWWLRHKRTHPGYRPGAFGPPLHVSYPYFACCLFAASAGNERTLWFPIALVTLVGWALWAHRSHGFRAVTWSACLLLAVALGVGLQLGALEAQRLLQRIDEALLGQWAGAHSSDANETHTRIGSIGRLKLSGRILLRLTTAQPPPALLRQASYNSFQAPFWTVVRRDFDHVTPETNQSTWNLHPAARLDRSLHISGPLTAGTGILALPAGAVRLQNLPAISLQTNLYGSFRVEDGPGFVDFDASYRNGSTSDSHPTDEDRLIPPAERPAILCVRDTLGLSEVSHEKALEIIERFFADNFTYSTWQDEHHRASGMHTALARFLLENRSGHCEYFATATTLLLRAAGIPARYATGFSVQEKKGKEYVVRERHAHAWSLAYVNGTWRDVDTTPASWARIEASRRSRWEPLSDLSSRIWFEFSRWRWGHAEWKHYLLWLIVPLIGLTLARLVLQKQWNRARRPGRLNGDFPRPGLDSEFYAVAQRLQEAGFARAPGETGHAWLQRLALSGKVSTAELAPLLTLHYQLRFDPAGLKGAQRAELRNRAQHWLAEHAGVD